MNKHLVKVVLGIALGVIAFVVIQKSSSASPARLPRLDGSVQVVASLMQTDPPVEVAGIRVTVSGPDLPARTETLTQLGTQWEGVLTGLPVGEGNTLTAEAFDAEGNVIFTAQSSGLGFSSTQRSVAALAMQKKYMQPMAMTTQEGPRLRGILSSGDAVKPGGSLTLQGSATSSTPGSELSYEWKASAGTVVSPNSASTTWIAPAEAVPVTFTFTVKEQDNFNASANLGLGIAHSHGLPSQVTFNHAPQVVAAAPVPAIAKQGQPISLFATVADEDPRTLVYKWSAQCKGTWSGADKAAATFMPGAQGPKAACTPCNLSLTTTASSGESAIQQFDLCVSSEVAPEGLPQIAEVYQSSTKVGPGDKVEFTVNAQDPLGGVLAYAWTANEGTIEETGKTNNESRAVWTAPLCVPAGVTLSIQVAVINALGSTTAPFTVTGLPACRTPLQTLRRTARM